MTYFSLDAVEGGIARLLDDDDSVFKVDAALLPPKAEEGSVLFFDEAGGRYRLDKEETARRRKALQEQLQRILSQNKEQETES